MSEYWKSTPKYWCKHCSVFVRDTKLEISNHEATTKHHSNLNRFLRNIHRDNDRAERERRRAKDEVARLNGSQGSATHEAAQKKLSSVHPAATPPERQATVEERMRQMAQLAEMGVAIPEEYRRDLAVVGEWQGNSDLDRMPGSRADTLQSEATVNPTSKIETKVKIKRQASDDDLDGSLYHKKRTAWGSRIRTYLDTKSSSTDLDIFLETYDDASTLNAPALESKPPKFKVEQDTSAVPETEATVKTGLTGIEEAQPICKDGGEIVFKKRRPKHAKK